MSATEIMLCAQALASSAMCGIIWFVQVIHYPSFALVGGDGRSFAQVNRRRTAPVVLVFMLVEAATAAVIAWSPPAGVPPLVAAAGLGLVVANVLSTAVVQLPLHGRLARDGHDPARVAALVRSNWLRTVLWTMRAVLAVWMVRAAA
ncbi:MAG: hypothetical protein ACKOZU_09560 [Planctomycetaceae bacterium]